MTRSLLTASLLALFVAAFTAGPALAHCGSCEASAKGEANDKCEACAKDAHVAPNTVALGLGGYSPVSYFTRSRPHVGSPKYQAMHEGVTYFFADAKEQAAFVKNPDKYVPAYGGWCAYGMAVEGQFPADPTNYKIVDGRLMVFLKNEEVDTRQAWNEGDETELTGKADAYYARLSE
jgi:YHS domain-containing protein